MQELFAYADISISFAFPEVNCFHVICGTLLRICSYVLVNKRLKTKQKETATKFGYLK